MKQENVGSWVHIGKFFGVIFGSNPDSNFTVPCVDTPISCVGDTLTCLYDELLALQNAVRINLVPRSSSCPDRVLITCKLAVNV